MPTSEGAETFSNVAYFYHVVVMSKGECSAEPSPTLLQGQKEN